MNQTGQQGDPTGDIMDGWMSRKELADALGVTAGTLAKWQSQRIGPPLVRIGRKVIYRREAVQEWLQSQESYWKGAMRR